MVVPRSLLNRRELEGWRAGLLGKHTLNAVLVLPDELFQPYASSTTAVLLTTKGVPQDPKRPVFFARIENDGFRLRKNVRVARSGSQIPLVLNAYRQLNTVPGLCAAARIAPGEEWAPGAYIPAKPLVADEIITEAQLLVRSKTALIIKYAPQFLALQESLGKSEIKPRSFSSYIKGRSKPPGSPGTIGSAFEIHYGQKELETKDTLPPGKVIVISSSGAENGCYGFFDFDWVISPPLVTAPRTGSIGHAHVQEWPCGVTSDCLVLLPRPGISLELLYVAAAVIRRERWRFDYSRKLTPERISGLPLVASDQILRSVREQMQSAARLERLVLGDRKLT